MAKRDVELIIRAKNEASRALDAAAKSMQQLEDQQASLGDSAKKTDNLLGQLTDEFSRLKSVATNIQAFDKIREQAERASEAFERQRADLQRSQEELEQLARAQANVVKESDRLQQEVTQSAAALKTQAAALAAAKKELNGYDAAARKAASAAETAEKALATARQRYAADPTPARETGLVDAALRVQQAKQLAREAALAQAQLSAAYRDQAAAVQQNKVAHSGIVKALADVKSAQRTLASEIKKTDNAVAQQTDGLTKAETEYAQLGQVVAKAEATFLQAANAQNVVGQSAQNVSQQLTILKARIQEVQAAQRLAGPSKFVVDAAVLDRANTGLRQSKQIIREASAEAENGSVSLRKLGDAVAQVARSGQQLRALEQAVRDQDAAVETAEQAWRSAQAEVKRLATALRDAAQPSEILATALGKAQGQARAAKTAFQQESAAAEQLSNGLRQAGLQHTTLANAQQQLRSLVAANNATLIRGRGILLNYGEAADRGAAGAKNAGAGIRKIKPAADEATRSLRDLLKQLSGLDESGRKSLSFFQRFRGQLLSLAASTGGLFAIQTALEGVIQAELDMEAVTSRFTVAFEGDQQKVARAMEFSRQTADELGLSFRTLALQYSKLSAASLGTNLEGEKTEKIFRSMSEAARVLRLTDEELEGTFKALTDIISKGTIQAEELKGQLGDRFPGAVQIMAKALGVGTEELAKMMEQGQLTSDKLADFAAEIGKRVAPGLKDAIESPAASFERLRNSILDIQLVIARSGFMQELADGADALAKALADPAVQEGFRKLGEGIAAFINGAVEFLPYIEEIMTALGALAAFMAVKFVGGAIVSTVAGLAQLRTAFQLVTPELKILQKAFMSAGGGAKGLLAILNSPLAKAGLYGIIAAELYVLADAAYEAYDANKQLQAQVQKSNKRAADASAELAAKQKAFAAAQAEAQGSLVKTQGQATLSAEKLAQATQDVLDTYKGAATGRNQYIRSQADVIEMTDKEIDAYQDLLIARMRVVGEARTRAMMNPDDEDSIRIIAETTAEMDRLSEAVANSAAEEAGRRKAAENTAAAVAKIGEAAVMTAQKADQLNTRLEALAQMNFDNTVLALEKVRNARMAALILSGADESKILQAETDFEEQRLNLVRQYSQKQLDLVAQDEQRRKATLDTQKLDAEKRAEELLKIEDDASQARQQIVQSEIQSVASARDQALNRYQAALGRIADIDRRIADLRLQGEFQVADIRRSAMDDYQSYLSRQAELTKLNGRIQEEVARGNLEVAESLAQRQLSLAQSLNQEVKNGEQVVVSKEQAATNAVKGTQKANENLISVLQKRKEAEQAEAAEQKKIYENLTSALEKLNQTLAKISGVEIPLTVDEQKAQDSLDNTLSRMKAVAFEKKVGVPITADTRDYVAKFDSEVLSKDGSQVRVGVFMEDGAYKLKVNEIQNQKIVATAAVEFSGADLQAAIARAKEIVEGDFPTMQLAFDSAETYAQFQTFTDDVKRELSESSFTVSAQFKADDAEVAAVVERYKTTVTPAPVQFNPDTAAADQARANVAQPIIVPVTYAPTNSPTGRSNGGFVQSRSNGGPIRGVPRFSGGGFFRGAGTSKSDSNLVALSDKEYVMRAMAVRKYGQGFMNAVNSGSLNADRIAGALSGGEGGDVAKLDLTLNQRNIGVLAGSRDTINNLVDALTEMSRQVGA